MEAAEKTLTYRHDTGLHRKLLKHDKPERTDHVAESNYVDLDMKPDGSKTVKVTFTGDTNQLSVVKSDNSKQEERTDRETASDEIFKERSEDKRHEVLLGSESPVEARTKPPNNSTQTEKQPELDSSECSDSDELRYTDMCLNSKTESDDGTSAELSDHCGSDTVEDESHYITTHEIQLTELDHDVDYDLGRGTRWEFEDGNLVYSFVDYTSFESDETQEGTLILEGRRSRAKVQSNLGEAAVSTEQEESDLCDSDESVCKNQSGENSAGKVHLSIQTSSRPPNDPVSVFDNSTCWYTKHLGDRGHVSFVSSGARAGPLCDRAPYFIPAPGRQHLATKLRRKDINEYSSGASSSISELDDADKEVRNLTAKSFRSLACPYFDAINLSTSSESSMSEYGLNKWSAYVDWNYGKERSVIAHKTSSAKLEMSETLDSRGCNKSTGSTRDTQTRFYSLNKSVDAQQAAHSSKKIQIKDRAQSAQRGVTLNFHCNDPRGPRCSQKGRPNQVSGTVLSRSGCQVQYHHSDSTGDTHKRAIFASSLLKNVISKKMQFEQERKMERGEISDTRPSVSPCFHIRDQDKDKSPIKGLNRQSSESGSACTADGSRPSSCGLAEETKGSRDHETQNVPEIRSQSGAFNSTKEAVPASGNDAETASQEGLDTSNVLTNLLFVPRCQLLTEDRDFTEDSTEHTPDTDAPSGSQICREEKAKEGNEEGGNTPEIKICLRNVKENKGCTLNIANLLTPKISSKVNKIRAADESRCQVLSVTDKVPNFTVRDMRDTRCKFQTPIYQVRDVRKLVKSSYRFVSVDGSGGKRSTAAEKLEEKTRVEPVKHLFPSPMVIKCNSVKTNGKSQMTDVSRARAEVDAPGEASQSVNASSVCATSRMKQGNPDQSEIQSNLEPKPGKQRQDEKRNDSTIPKQDALEKIKAAVKTMEQLYVFDRNEWKRKSQASHPVTDSHVLSLLTREEHGADEQPVPQPLTNTPETGRTPGGKGALNIIHVPFDSRTFKTPPSKTFTNKSILHLGNRNNIISDTDPQSSTAQNFSAVKISQTSVAPLSVKVEPQKQGQMEREKVESGSNNNAVTHGCSDYLTIPGLGLPKKPQLLSQDPVSTKPEKKRSPLIMEYPAATIYHHASAALSPQSPQQVLCFSPSVPTVSPTPSAGDTVPQTQRKMLLDPTTGHYYLVDTPIQATTKRLFDPETAQYVDVPMPRSPVAPVTHVPLSLSPLALSPGAYTPTYMIYPGFIPSPTLMMTQSPCHSEDAAAAGENLKNTRSPEPQLKSEAAEKVYYSATGEAPQRPLHLPVSLGHVTTRESGASSDRKALISITSQQGPRIIAPPSFDGRTMSFIVEHR